MATDITLKSLAPILAVKDVSGCVPFWQNLGFSVSVTVPEVAPFDFAILAHDGIEVMLQSRASVQQDMPGVAEHIAASVLYLSVASLEPVLAVMTEADIVVPRRTTFYGADEIFLRDPAGNVIGFSAPST